MSECTECAKKDRIIADLRRDLRDTEREAREAARDAAAEARWQEQQGDEYGSY